MNMTEYARPSLPLNHALNHDEILGRDCAQYSTSYVPVWNYDVLDQKVWAVALCRELPSPAWRGVYRRG